MFPSSLRVLKSVSQAPIRRLNYLTSQKGLAGTFGKNISLINKKSFSTCSECSKKSGILKSNEVLDNPKCENKKETQHNLDKYKDLIKYWDVSGFGPTGKKIIYLTSPLLIAIYFIGAMLYIGTILMFISIIFHMVQY